MRDVRKTEVEGITVSCVHVECGEYSPGMATCAKDVLELTDSDVLFMAVSYIHGKKNPYRHVSVIGRAKPVKSVDLSDILTSSLRGGGHPKAASAAFRMDQPLSDPNLAALQEVGSSTPVSRLVSSLCVHSHRLNGPTEVYDRRGSVNGVVGRSVGEKKMDDWTK